MPRDVWTIALAAGAGRRLASAIGRTPKQFWRPDSASGSLLESTLWRLQPIASPHRTVTIVDASHQSHVRALSDQQSLGHVVYQPMDRGTAVGVLLPLLTILERSPDAIIVLTPSDHGVDDEVLFRSGLTRGIARIRAGLSEVVLFGVEPTAVAADYGWITPTIAGPLDPGHFQLVADFVEKPPLFDAFHLFMSGAVWNTMVLVASGRALLNHFRAQLPFLTDMLMGGMSLDAAAREIFLGEWYPELPHADFSRDLLTSSKPLCLFTWPSEVGWSDLGTPERLEQWLESHSGLAPVETRR